MIDTLSTQASLDESAKNATRREMNSEMQKLLGDEIYQQYRKARVANTAKAVAKAKGAGAGGAALSKKASGKKKSSETV